MDVAFQVAAKGMDSNKDTRDHFFLVGNLFDAIGSNFSDEIEKLSVVPEEIPKLRGHSKGNMLP